MNQLFANGFWVYQEVITIALTTFSAQIPSSTPMQTLDVKHNFLNATIYCFYNKMKLELYFILYLLY